MADTDKRFWSHEKISNYCEPIGAVKLRKLALYMIEFIRLSVIFCAVHWIKWEIVLTNDSRRTTTDEDLTNHLSEWLK